MAKAITGSFIQPWFASMIVRDNNIILGNEVGYCQRY